LHYEAEFLFFVFLAPKELNGNASPRARLHTASLLDQRFLYDHFRNNGRRAAHEYMFHGMDGGNIRF